MSESFEDAMTLARMIMAECDMPLLDRLQDAHDRELEQARDPQRIGGMLERGSFEYALEQLREFRWQHATNDEDAIPYINNVARAHEQAVKSEYHRGHEDGRRSMDADHAAVALRLRQLRFDEGSHENLHKVAYAIYPCATGWTCESSRGLRDELVRLLGGVSERQYTTSIYDVLGNERHKAVCRLREYEPRMGGKPTEEASKLIRCITGNDDSHVACANDLEETRDRLIHLLGGDEPTAMEYIQRIVREHDRKCLDMELSGAELGQANVEAMSRRADQSHESSPMRLENETGITAELRECVETARKSHDRCISEAELLEIADRMDEREHKLRKQCDELQAKLEEAEFAIANWREREKSFDESERERDELRRERDELRERLDRVADALRGVERGTMSAWEAADGVGR